MVKLFLWRKTCRHLLLKTGQNIRIEITFYQENHVLAFASVAWLQCDIFVHAVQWQKSVWKHFHANDVNVIHLHGCHFPLSSKLTLCNRFCDIWGSYCGKNIQLNELCLYDEWQGLRTKVHTLFFRNLPLLSTGRTKCCKFKNGQQKLLKPLSPRCT